MKKEGRMTTTIIAGRFLTQDEVDHAVEELQRCGFARERISTFYVNPPGQHDTFPIGGDRAASPGAKETDKGVAAGAATGAAVGAAAGTPLFGPLGTAVGGLVGAHVGGLVGGVSEMKEKGETGEHGEEAENAAPVRKSGMMVAVAADDHEHEELAIKVLRSAGANDPERAEGTIENGEWSDFNPLAMPVLLQDMQG
jgi:hypothetical protein